MTLLLPDLKWRAFAPEMIHNVSLRQINSNINSIAINQKYLDIHDFRDPRPLENLEKVTNPDWDSGLGNVPKFDRDTNHFVVDLSENHNSFSNPLPPFHPRLSQFDAQIWEMCDLASPRVLMPHRDSSGVAKAMMDYRTDPSSHHPYHHQLRPIMNWAKCSVHEALEISEIGKALDATKPMMKEFCREAKDDLESFLNKMRVFVDGLSEIQESYNKPWELEIPASIRVNKGALAELYKMLPDENNEPEKEEIEKPEISKTLGYHIFKDFSEIDDLRRDLWEWYKDYYMNAPPDGLYDTILGLSNDDTESLWYSKFNWIRKQDPEFINLLIRIRKGNLAEIGKVAKDVFSSEIKLSRVQKSVFFTEYNIRKKYLTPPVRPFVYKMINKINNANGRLGYIGSKLYQIQHGLEPNFKYVLQKHELNMLWSAWKKQKKLHGGNGGNRYEEIPPDIEDMPFEAEMAFEEMPLENYA